MILRQLGTATGFRAGMPHGGRPAIRCGGKRWRIWNSPRSFPLSESQRPTSMHLAAGLGLELPESPVICTDEQMSRFPPEIPKICSVLADVQEGRGRRPGPGPARQQSRRAVPTKSKPVSHWLAPAQVVTRTHRRMRKPPLTKDDPASVLCVLLIFLVLPWLAIFMLSLHGCD